MDEIYPEYWIIKVGKFNNIIWDKLDEWIYFLKNGEVQDDFSAKGLPEPARTVEKTTDKLFIPFKGDRGLSVVLIKAFLLVEDTKVADGTIVSQIGRG